MTRKANLENMFKKRAELDAEAPEDKASEDKSTKDKVESSKVEEVAGDPSLGELDNLLGEIKELGGNLDDASENVDEIEETVEEKKEASSRALINSIIRGDIKDPEMEKIASDVTLLTLEQLINI